MTTERRRYFRISDRALVKYRVIAEEALEAEKSFVYMDEVRSSNLHTAMMGIDRRLADLFELARADSRPIAEALELLNRKMTLLERVVTMENSPFGSTEYHEHEPVEVNLSGGGMSLQASEPLPLNAYLAIDLIVLPSHHPMRVIGRIVDCRSAENGYAIAIDFAEMRDEDRDLLVQHVLRRQSAILREERGLEHDFHAA